MYLQQQYITQHLTVSSTYRINVCLARNPLLHPSVHLVCSACVKKYRQIFTKHISLYTMELFPFNTAVFLMNAKKFGTKADEVS